MRSHVICYVCAEETTVTRRRGERLSDLRCALCGGDVERAGSKPSDRARLIRIRAGRDPETGEELAGMDAVIVMCSALEAEREKMRRWASEDAGTGASGAAAVWRGREQLLDQIEKWVCTLRGFPTRAEREAAKMKDAQDAR